MIVKLPAVLAALIAGSFCVLSVTSSYVKRIKRNEIESGKCEPMAVSLCKDIAYDKVIMPNLLGHTTQNEASEDIKKHSKMMNSLCSPDIKLFLCSLYAPVCTELEIPLPPCRSLCLSAKNGGCDSYLQKLYQMWPKEFGCERFNESNLCVSHNKGSKTTGVSNNNKSNKDFYTDDHNFTLLLTCPERYKTSKTLDYKVVLGPVISVEHCGIPCDDPYMYLGKYKQKVVMFVVGLVACFCLVSSLFTICTFFIDKKRFGYPQRPFIYIALCHIVISILYIGAFAFKGSTACTEPFPESNLLVRRRIAIQGSHKELCTTLFALMYYFMMASHLWWVGLNFAWLLSACLKWSEEAIEKNAKFFHIVAWMLPAIQLVTALFVAKIDGDPVTGLCGLLEPMGAKSFIFTPLIFYSVLGIFCWGAGLIGLSKVRTSVKNEGFNSDKLDKLMLRVGVFGLLYMVPTVTYIVCIFYEQMMRYAWNFHWYFEICPFCFSFNSNEASVVNQPPSPPSSLFHLLKNLSSLLMGFSSGYWVWNQKTRKSWEKTLSSLFSKA